MFLVLYNVHKLWTFLVIFLRKCLVLFCLFLLAHLLLLLLLAGCVQGLVLAPGSLFWFGLVIISSCTSSSSSCWLCVEPCTGARLAVLVWFGGYFFLPIFFFFLLAVCRALYWRQARWRVMADLRLEHIIISIIIISTIHYYINIVIFCLF